MKRRILPDVVARECARSRVVFQRMSNAVGQAEKLPCAGKLRFDIVDRLKLPRPE